jgi:hypothetical protein
MNKFIKLMNRIATFFGIFIFLYSSLFFFIKDLTIVTLLSIGLTAIMLIKYGKKIELHRWALHFLGCYSIPFIVGLLMKEYTNYGLADFVWIPITSILMICIGYYIETMQVTFSKYDLIADIIGALYPTLMFLSLN